MHGTAVIRFDMQRKCVAVVLYCAFGLVGRIPTLLFTEIRVQD